MSLMKEKLIHTSVAKIRVIWTVALLSFLKSTTLRKSCTLSICGTLFLVLRFYLLTNRRLEKGDTTIIPDKIFHLRYRVIVGSLDYLVNMTRPDLAFAYSELSKYVQCP